MRRGGDFGDLGASAGVEDVAEEFVRVLALLAGLLEEALGRLRQGLGLEVSRHGVVFHGGGEFHSDLRVERLLHFEGDHHATNIGTWRDSGKVEAGGAPLLLFNPPESPAPQGLGRYPWDRA